MNASEDRLPLRKRQAGLSADYADFTDWELRICEGTATRSVAVTLARPFKGGGQGHPRDLRRVSDVMKNA